jgi:hypothetical protein
LLGEESAGGCDRSINCGREVRERSRDELPDLLPVDATKGNDPPIISPPAFEVTASAFASMHD